MHQRSLGLVLTVLAAALFGTLGIFGKGAVTIDLSVTTLLASRFVVAAVILWGLLLLTSRSALLPTRVVGLEIGLGVVYRFVCSYCTSKIGTPHCEWLLAVRDRNRVEPDP